MYANAAIVNIQLPLEKILMRFFVKNQTVKLHFCYFLPCQLLLYIDIYHLRSFDRGLNLAFIWLNSSGCTVRSEVRTYIHTSVIFLQELVCPAIVQSLFQKIVPDISGKGPIDFGENWKLEMEMWDRQSYGNS